MGLNIENLSVAIDGKQILSNVSAAFKPGRITAILGPNGAGKSTLLKAISDLISSESGEILLDGRLFNSLLAKERAKKIAYLPQNYNLVWDIKVPEVVALGRYAHGDVGLDAIQEALEITDTAQFFDRTTGQLSGGELARVMLARVLAGEPDWILADEPLASLDPAYQLDLISKLRLVASSGTAIIIVLHDINLAARLADDIVMLKQGEILAAGSVKETLTESNIAALYDIDVKQVQNGLFQFD